MIFEIHRLLKYWGHLISSFSYHGGMECTKDHGYFVYFASVFYNPVKQGPERNIYSILCF